MKKINLKSLIGILFIATSFIMIGCEEKVSNEIPINYGAFVDQNNSDYKTFNLIEEGSYEEINTDNKIINNYNKKSNTYTYYMNDSFYVNYNNIEMKLEDENISDIKISNDGNYIFYFINDDIFIPVVINLKTKEKIYLKNKSVISGEFIDFISDNTLVFYGVDLENKVSAIFSYNIDTNEESSLYKIENGYVKLLKQTDNKIALAIEYFDGTSSLVSIDKNGVINEITKDILEISDIEILGEKCYIIGRMKNNNFSIYEITDENSKRIIFDFPNKVHDEKGLSFTKENEILFIGSMDGEEENIYKYSGGSISLIASGFKNLNFINVN